jgi:putative inorganic carbon (HCO3(-)) transporter
LSPALDIPSVTVYCTVFFLMLALGARRPQLGTAGLIAIDPFSFYHLVGATTITLPKTALIGMLLGLLSRRPRLKVIFARGGRPILIGSLLIVAATAISVMQAAHLADALRETLKAFEYFITFATVILAMHEEHDERHARIAFTLTTIAVSLSACMQLHYGAPSVLPYENHLIPRIAGPLEGPNQLSGYLGLMLPVLAAFTVLREPLPLHGESIALILGTVTLLLTFSRAGVLTTFAAIALVIALAPAARRRYACMMWGAGTCVGIGVVSALGYGITHDFGLLRRFAGTDESAAPGSVGKRSQLWHAALVLWKSRPWLGIGAGNFESEVSTVGLHGIKTHANSLYLQSLVEGGLPLFGAQLYTLCACVLTFARSALREPFVLGALATTMGLALHQIVDLLIFYPKIGGMWWILLALGACAGPRDAKRAE